MEIPTWVLILFLSIGFAYYLIVLVFTLGWFFMMYFQKPEKNPSVTVSIIIPARNEENNIMFCLRSLTVQNYPKELFEVLVVDDHSEDKTAELINQYADKIHSSGINLRLLSSNNVSGKKNAIDFAIRHSTGKFIITLDADCVARPDWIATIASYYEEYHPQMIVSPVIFSENTSLLGKWQALEFYSLVVSGAGAVSAGHPILCNGANLAYAKEAYLAVGGFTRGEMFASGDDTFLLFSIAARYGKHAIRFLKSYDAIVKTNAIATFSGFVRQRLRWVSKTRGYTDVWTIQTALVVFLFNTILLTGLCLGIFNTSFLRLTLIIWGVKILIDFPLLAGYTSFARQRRLLWGYLPLSLVYPFYICFFALAGQVWKPRWKGRK